MINEKNDSKIKNEKKEKEKEKKDSKDRRTIGAVLVAEAQHTPDAHAHSEGNDQQEDVGVRQKTTRSGELDGAAPSALFYLFLFPLFCGF